MNGGGRGIRTLDTGLAYTHFPGVRLQPLGHPSGISKTTPLSTSAQDKISFFWLFSASA